MKSTWSSTQSLELREGLRHCSAHFAAAPQAVAATAEAAQSAHAAAEAAQAAAKADAAAEAQT